MERTLLLVDDEQNILRALQRLFRRDGYRILTASSGQDGLSLLAEHDVGVIISDQRMPQMTGVEFLSRVREHHPDTVRIVLSGYTELESVTTAINEGAIYKFLTKPWDDGLLRRNIQEAFHHYELAHENQRLTEQLRVANAELSDMNRELEQRVLRKTREVTLNMQALRVSQHILEFLPVGVLGVDEDGMVVVCNQTAQNLLNPDGSSLVGTEARHSLPKDIVDAAKQLQCQADMQHIGMMACHAGKCEVRFAELKAPSTSRGQVFVITPDKERRFV